jgi:hypothetical protein
MMNRLLTVLCPALCAALVAGCGSTKEIPPREALFVTNDCQLIAAIAKERYNFKRDDPPRRLRLNGEDAPWRPGCDWQGMGFNLVEVSGPEGVAATAGMAEVSFNRPRYDVEGALVRTSMTPDGGAAERVLCRLSRAEAGWSIASCGPDPKDVLPRAAAPSPADATPDSARLPAPNRDQQTPRDATIPDPNPGGSTPNSP